MNCILRGLVLFLVFSSIEATSKCPLAFKPPEQCFFADELKEYSSTATGIESLYNKYVNLLTDAKLTIDGDEVKCIIKCARKTKLNSLVFAAGCESLLWRGTITKSSKT
jgi:hypothetical protein